jgi:N-acetylglucosaminyldiphosphoundecaprenol N-acetyl-beta-D-mannosaminyltransferase
MTPLMWAVASGALPFVLLLRGPFLRLPLHIDTGFYVSNATISSGRFRFSRGWNALLAGCSKFIPEWFYSRVYLAHRGKGYSYWSRIYMSVYAWLSSLAVGLLAWRIAGGSEEVFAAAVGLYLCISSEPQYGGYFESGEQFEALPQAAAVMLLHEGLVRGSPWLAGSGLLLWMAQAVFIKLSSVLTGVVLAIGCVILKPALLPALLGAGIVSFFLYVAWISINGRSFAGMLRGLTSHEVFLSRRKSALTHVIRRFGKGVFLALQLLLGPTIPLLAVAGAVAHPDSLLLFWLGGALLTHGVQSGLVWYYAIPLQPALAVFGALAPSPWRWIGGGIALLLLLARSRLVPRLHHAVWGLYESSFPIRNEALERLAEELRGRIAGQSLLVFGRWNQACVLLNAAYETPIVSAAQWLQTMKPGWEQELIGQLIKDPPLWILDTEDALDEVALRNTFGLSYELDRTFAPSFRLFAFRSSQPLRDPAAGVFREPAPPLKQDVFGIPVANLDQAGLARILIDRAHSGVRGGEVLALNVHTLIEGHRDPSYRRLFRDSFLVFADGVPIVWASKMLWSPLTSRTHGHDLMRETLRASVGNGVRHYFLGGTQGTLDELLHRATEEFPGLQIAGTYSPPFRKLSAQEDHEIADRINAAAPGILWVAFGAPKQERWIQRMKPLLNTPVIAGVGAAFEIMAGRFSRAPIPAQRLGMEWAWRLAQDPARLWRRYFSTNGCFLGLCLATLGRRLLAGSPSPSQEPR